MLCAFGIQPRYGTESKDVEDDEARSRQAGEYLRVSNRHLQQNSSTRVKVGYSPGYNLNLQRKQKVQWGEMSRIACADIYADHSLMANKGRRGCRNVSEEAKVIVESSCVYQVRAHQVHSD
jgi:hypothetical protein